MPYLNFSLNLPQQSVCLSSFLLYPQIIIRTAVSSHLRVSFCTSLPFKRQFFLELFLLRARVRQSGFSQEKEKSLKWLCCVWCYTNKMELRPFTNPFFEVSSQFLAAHFPSITSQLLYQPGQTHKSLRWHDREACMLNIETKRAHHPQLVDSTGHNGNQNNWVCFHLSSMLKTD